MEVWRRSGALRTKNPALKEQERIRIADVYFAPEDIAREDRVFWRPPVQVDEERPLATQITDEQVEEAINNESLYNKCNGRVRRSVVERTHLVNIAHSINKERGLQREQRYQ